MKLSNRQYDALKWIALVVIPAAATLTLTVGKIWGLPYYDNVAATISAVGLFIAAVIGASGKGYGDGASIGADSYIAEGGEDGDEQGDIQAD